MSRLMRGADAGGVRYFLDGRPVHAGTGLELRLPEATLGPVWATVRFETMPVTNSSDLLPVLYLYLGHTWEHRFRAVEAAAIASERQRAPAGAWVVYDERQACAVRLDTRTLPDEDFPEGRLVYGDHLDDRDVWTSRADAERAAAALRDVMEGFPTVPIPVLSDAHMDVLDLRWPSGGERGVN